jgi:UDP-N-acetylglucosamine 2-epimerase (non-hydrolysing)
MKVAVIVGTRPELIKMGVLIKELKKRNSQHLFIHSGQHYDYHMDGMVSDSLKLPPPDYHLGIGSISHASFTAAIMQQLEAILLKEKVGLVIVHGDTNTTLGASLAAAKMNIKVTHVEAGLRSYDRNMPEEINRVLVDHISSHLFCPTKEAVTNLQAEGITKDVHLVGQTLVDAVSTILSADLYDVLGKYKLSTKDYFFLTVHRQENTDILDRLRSIFSAVTDLTQLYPHQIVIAMHPRTKKILQHNDMYQTLSINSSILLLDPPPNFYETIHLQKQAKLVLTDSGGLQEESCILGAPCITLRENTERPETLQCGSNRLAGYKRDSIIEAVANSLSGSGKWVHPYGNIGVSSTIVDILLGS